MQELCEIDLIDSVHDRKMKLIQEEKLKEIERREKEILRLEKKRKEEEMKRKAEKEALERIELENLNHRKRLEKIAMNKKINISLSNVEILKINDEIEKDIIDINHERNLITVYTYIIVQWTDPEISYAVPEGHE